jgi:hypothetical protein
MHITRMSGAEASPNEVGKEGITPWDRDASNVVRLCELQSRLGLRKIIAFRVEMS